MILINKNSTNRFALEFPQLESSETYFLFSFQYEGTSDDYYIYFTASDISSACNRYSLFEVTESDDEEVDTIKLELGQWEYNVWVSDADWGTFSNPNVEPPAKISGSIQTGRVVVQGQTTTEPVYEGTPIEVVDPNEVYK
jgi:hypothetical protein